MDILVDLDGTLIDPKPGILGSIQHALRRLGAPVPPVDDLAWAIGPPLRGTFARLLGDPARAEAAVALYRETYRDGAMYDAVVYPGIPQALETLIAAGCRLIVATAKPHVFARPILERFDLARHFTAVHGPELDGTNDSKADLIAHIIEVERVQPDAAVMIGDREHDVAAAARNGIRSVGVTWGYGSVAELTAAGAARLCTAPPSLAPTALCLLSQAGPSPIQLSHR
ncbi:MAG: HAD hydrolase-like protein [Hyphomonadaceae bacterium]|jgi:phosphoglycolate phosphatase|nr:HAD hydrolase-like protein [Hyphomonadaceae bacterium]